MTKEFEDILEEEEGEEIIEIGEDFTDLGIFGQDPVWEIPLIRRLPNPEWTKGSKEPKTKAYRVWIPVKMLTQAELLRMQEGQRIPKGSRNILDAMAIKRWSKAEVDMLNTAIQRAGGKIKFVNAPRGKVNYAAGEMSIEDLSRQDIRALEGAISPGMNKSEEDFEVELRAGRRQAGSPPAKSRRMSLDAGGATKNPESGPGQV